MVKFAQYQNPSLAYVGTGQTAQRHLRPLLLNMQHYPHCVGHKYDLVFLKFAAIITASITTSVLECDQGNSDSFGKPGPP